MTQKELRRLRKLAAGASHGPWRSMRDGNQYVKTSYLPTAVLVGASRVEGLVRPWNPYAHIAFGSKAEDFEIVRLKDADADYVAAVNPAVMFELLGMLERLAGYQRFACLKCGCKDFDYEVGEHPGICYCNHTDMDHRHDP